MANLLPSGVNPNMSGVKISGVNRNVIGVEIIGLSGYGSDAELASIELFKKYPEELLQFAAACCMLFIVVGIPGNFVTIVALARYKKIRNATALFIINLSCSDLLFCCLMLPPTVCIFLKRSWTFGIILCKIFPLMNYGLTATSILTIVLITINRYVMIAHPKLYSRLYQKQNILLMVIGVWCCAFGMLLPTYFEIWGRFSLDHHVGFCTIISDVNDKSPKTLLVVMAFAAPSTVMVLCYSRILWLVRKSAKKSGDRRDGENINSSDQKTGKVENISPREYSESSDCSTREHEKSESGKANVSSAVRIIRNNFKATFRKAHGRRRIGPTKKDKRLRTMILAIIITFFSCHLPIMVAKTMSSEPYVNITGYILIYLTTCVNPIIYVVMSREYRQAYRNLFCR